MDLTRECFSASPTAMAAKLHTADVEFALKKHTSPFFKAAVICPSSQRFLKKQ